MAVALLATAAAVRSPALEQAQPPAPAAQPPAAQPPAAPAPGSKAPSAQAPALSPAAAGEDRPAEQVFKNIKVLTGMPASQMLPVMHIMRASLGVRCDFCHVAENDSYHLDTKKEKETARKMIRMVLAINRENFDGRTQVSCNTCHRGAEHTVRVPPIDQGRFEDTTRGPAEEEAREKLPAAAEILDRYIQALGGRPALTAVKSRVSRGTLLRAKVVDSGTPKARAVNRGEEDPLEIVQRAPDQATVTLGPASQQIVMSFAGGSGTIKTPRGERAMTPEEVARDNSLTDLQAELKLREQADKARVAGTDKIEGRDVLVLRTTAPDGNPQILYFDAQSGLLRRRIVQRPTILGPDPEQTDFEDYRDVGGVKVPFLVTVSYLDDNHRGVTRKLAEVRHK